VGEGFRTLDPSSIPRIPVISINLLAECLQRGSGGDPADEKVATRKGMTVTEVCYWYLSEAESVRLLGRRNRPIKSRRWQWTEAGSKRISSHCSRRSGKPYATPNETASIRLRSPPCVFCVLPAFGSPRGRVYNVRGCMRTKAKSIFPTPRPMDRCERSDQPRRSSRPAS
jgi:hypothetical protein